MAALNLSLIFKDTLAAKKQCYGLIGYPLSHSLSPAMHNAAMKKLGLPAEYKLIPVRPSEWKSFLQQARALPLSGFNVTVPYKEQIFNDFDHSSELAKNDDPDQDALQCIEAYNTMTFRDRKWRGDNTDGYGFLQDLADQNIKTQGKNVVILGAGGSARILLFSMHMLKARPRQVTLINRSVDKARRLKKFFLNYQELGTDIGADFPVDVAKIEEEKRAAVMQENTLLINATSLGLMPLDPSEPHAVNFEWLHKDLFVYDLIYHRDTELLRHARLKGAAVSGGLGMLVNQGAKAFELWFGQKAPVNVMRKAAEKELQQRNAPAKS